MTVKDLIARLELVQDKNLPIYVDDVEWPIEASQASHEVIDGQTVIYIS